MHTPRDFEMSFARALRDPNLAIPEGITCPKVAKLARRFAVHRNNVMAGLIDALRNRFVAVEKIVGEDFFRAMAHAFVVARPARTPVLASFGDEFGDFIASFKPARDQIYLADIARLEAARTRAYHAADVTPADASIFASLDPETVADIRIDLHPSVEVIRSPHPIVTIWAMNSAERDLEPIDDWPAEDALVARPSLDVEVRKLPVGGAAFLLALAAHQTIHEAATAAYIEASAFDLTHSLVGLMNSGVVSGIVTPAESATIPL